MSTIAFRSTIAAVLVAAASPALSANLIVNGGFEDVLPAPGGYTTYGSGANIGGWTVIGSSSNNAVMTLSTSYTEPGVAFPAFEGLASLDLTGAGNTLDGGVQQLVNLTVGAQYVFKLSLANTAGTRTGGGNNPFYLEDSSLKFNISGLSETTLTNGITTLPSTSNWLSLSLFFTATQANTTISIVNNTVGPDNAALLDAVSLELVSAPAVPEPSSWAMMIAGFGPAGLAMRRRNAARLAFA